MPLPEPTPAMAAVFLILALHLCAVYTGLGAFAFAWLSELLAGVNRQTFLKKLAQQMSALGVLFLAYTLVAVGGSMAVLNQQYPEFIRPWLEAPLLAAPPAAALAWLALFGLIHALTWRSSRNHPGLHRAIGLLAALGAPLVLACSLAVKLAAYNAAAMPADPGALATVLSQGAAMPIFAPLFTGSLLQALTCATGFGLAYLLLRRNRDDFGRDYYVFTVAHTAKWAMIFALCSAAAEAWACSQILGTPAPGTPPSMLPGLAVVGFAALALAIVLWALVWRSRNPLRMKPAIVLAALALLTAVGAFSALHATLFLAA